MLKILGIGIVVGVCVYLGYLEKDNLQRRENQLQTMIFAVNAMADRISYGREPMQIILQKTAESSGGVTADFLKAVAADLEKGSGSMLSEIWRRQMQNFEDRLAFKPSDYVVLNDFALGLGISHTQDQLQKIALSCGRLEQNLQEAKSEKQRLGKVFQASGWCMGIVLALLFA